MRRLALLVAVAAMVPAAVGGAHAQSTPLSDVFNIVGTWSITSDSDGDNPPAVDLLGGSGTFHSNAEESCAYESDGDGGVADGETGTCTVSLLGNFASTICGTGTAIGRGTFLSTPLTGDDEAGNFGFTVTFTNFIGVLSGTFDDIGESDTDTVHGTVVFAESSNPPTNDTSDCASNFTAVIGMTATE